MSIDPEDSVLEDALRRDLPSADAEARLRRRLLAAGVVVSNGIATTTAAASGAAATSASATGVLAKALGMSWGIKLGLTAAVAIPTLGLWLDDRGAAPQDPAPPPAVVLATATEPKLTPALPAPALPAEPGAAAEPAVAVAPERALERRARPVVEAPEAVALPLRPSQSDFGAVPAAPASSPHAPSTLGDETRLLDGAFAELSAGSLGRAAALIAEHEARYPRGLLAKERERAKIRLSELSRGE
jgi:hypothetical protein